MGRLLERLRNLQWEASIMERQVGRLRDLFWEIDLVQDLKLREAPLVEGQFGRFLARIM